MPTRDRADRLLVLLRSLSAQDLPTDQFEVIVVDDGSARPPELPHGAPATRILRHASARGPAAARNTGWRAARAPLVAFIDDDCRAAPAWLRALLRAWDGDENLIAQGRTEPDPEHAAAAGPFSRTISVGGPDGLYETCNIAYPRSLLERVQGFDERFEHACGEDVELGHRATKAGAQLAFSQQALVYHAVHPGGALAAIRHTLAWTDAVRLLKLHPQVREHLVARVFWKPTHPLLILATAGSVLGARWRSPAVALAACLPYVAHHRRGYRARKHGRPALVRDLPLHVAVDGVEIGTMVAGSIRHRTLML